jgi:hypothetical protein
LSGAIVQIGNQTAGVINNVEGVQHVDAAQTGVVVGLDDARRAARDLADALARVPLPPEARADVQARAAEIEREVSRPEPDRGRVTEHLTGLARVLSAAGAVGTAITGLATPLLTIGHWVGAAAGPVLALLGL